MEDTAEKYISLKAKNFVPLLISVASIGFLFGQYVISNSKVNSLEIKVEDLRKEIKEVELQNSRMEGYIQSKLGKIN